MDRLVTVHELEADIELVYELDPYDGPEPSRPDAYDPFLEVEMELVDDELVDPWFIFDDDTAESELPPIEGVYEIDPVHPLRRLGSWVVAGLRRVTA